MWKTPALWDSTFSCAWFSQVFQNQMTLEVQKLKNAEQNCATDEECVSCPCGRCVWRVKEEVHVENSKENPIMSRVLKDVHKRHRVIAKPVHQNSLEFTLYVVKEYHKDSKFLIQCVFWLFTVDFFLENYQQKRNQDGSEILNQKHGCPAYLRTKIFETKHCLLQFDVLFQGSVFVCKWKTFWITKS